MYRQAKVIMLRISEAAALLGITPTTLRRWEVKDRIHPVRTAGGERRYYESEVAELKVRPGDAPTAKGDRQSTEGDRQPDEPPASDDRGDDGEFLMSAATNPSRRGPRDVRQDLRHRRVEEGTTVLEWAERELSATRERGVREAARRAAGQEAQRLIGLRQYGKMLATMSGAPAKYCDAIARDLESYVTATQFPSSDWARSYEKINTRVERHLKPWREEQEQRREDAAHEAEKQRRRDQREDLRATGRTHAESETLSWDTRERERAMREVERSLRDSVRSDSTRDDVIALVDDVLGQWE